MLSLNENKLYICLILGFGFLLSQFLYYGESFFPNSFIQLMSIMTLQFLIYWGLFKNLPGGENKNIWPILICIGVISRLILLPSHPLLEDDHYRYLWDGKVLFHGINPYIHAPGAEALDFIHEKGRLLINFPQFKTIYPPMAQFLFVGTYAIFGSKLIGLKLIFLVFDLLCAFFIFKLARKDWRFPSLFLYLYNPLVLKEVANSVHLDVFAAFLILLSFWFLKERKNIPMSSFALALGAGVKLFPIFLFPFIFKLMGNKKVKGTFVFTITMIAMYLPFINAGLDLWAGTNAFAKFWTFNSSIQALFSFIGFKALPWIEPWLIKFGAKSLCGLLFLMISFLVWRNTSEENIYSSSSTTLLTLLLLSPVFNAWYLIWVLPFAILTMDRKVFLLCYLIFFGYSFFEFPSYYPIFKVVFFSIFGFFVIYEYKNRLLRTFYSSK